MIVVGKEKGVDSQGNKINYRYSDIDFDEKGWVSVKDALPLDFDLVTISSGEKTMRGWWTGSDWYAIRLRKGDKIIKWRRIKEG